MLNVLVPVVDKLVKNKLVFFDIAHLFNICYAESGLYSMCPVTALTDPFVRLCLVVSGSSKTLRDQWNCSVYLIRQVRSVAFAVYFIPKR